MTTQLTDEPSQWQADVLQTNLMMLNIPVRKWTTDDKTVPHPRECSSCGVAGADPCGVLLKENSPAFTPSISTKKAALSQQCSLSSK
jgi:hypothetical protein